MSENTIKLYRKAGATKSKKASKAKLAEVERLLTIKARVRRPMLEGLFTSGEFWKLPALTAAQIDSKADRILTHVDAGVVLDADSLGRRQRIDGSTAESIRLWIKKFYADTGIIGADEFAIVVEPVL